MWKKIIDLWKYSDIYEKNAIQAINEWTADLLWWVIKNSPVDTWKFLKWNKRVLAKKVWEKVIWEVYNDSEDAYNVENWWRKTSVNWHKNRKKWWPVIFTWIWSNTYLRTFLEKRKELKNNLIKKILW